MRRSPYVITPAEADDWLVDSAIKSITYHRTSRQAARDIVDHGVDVSRSWIGAYGQGFYTATDPDAFYGEADVVVAIRARNPLRGSEWEIASFIDNLVLSLRPRDRGLTPAGAVAVRRRLLELGYDGLVVFDAGGDGVDYVIAIEGGTVKVVT